MIEHTTVAKLVERIVASVPSLLGSRLDAKNCDEYYAFYSMENRNICIRFLNTQTTMQGPWYELDEYATMRLYDRLAEVIEATVAEVKEVKNDRH